MRICAQRWARIAGGVEARTAATGLQGAGAEQDKFDERSADGRTMLDAERGTDDRIMDERTIVDRALSVEAGSGAASLLLDVSCRRLAR
jgi:hypothetical protein